MAEVNPAQAAMNEAAERKFAEVGYTPENSEQIKQKAMEMLQDPVHMKRFQDMKKIATYAGAPITQIILDHLINIGNASASVKKKLNRDLEKETETDKKKGSIEFKFENRETKMEVGANVFIDECAADHNTGKELDKIKNIIDAKEWPRILHEVSQFINLARAYYDNFIGQRASLTDTIKKHIPEGVTIFPLKVDEAHSTLFLEGVTKRIGLFVVIN